MASAAVDFTIGKGDILPWLVVAPQTAAGTAITPSGTISFVITNPDTGASAPGAGTAELFTDTDSVVKLRYKWAAADTATAGNFYGQFKDLFGGTDQESFPNNDKILFQVFDKSPGQILTSKADYQAVRDYLGVTSDDLPDSSVEGIGFLQASEAFIASRLAVQTATPTLTQIMAGTSPATAADKTFLKAAVVYRIAYLFAVGETSQVDTAVSIGPVNKDLGGIGAQWKDAREESLKDCDQALASITGFKKWRTL